MKKTLTLALGLLVSAAFAGDTKTMSQADLEALKARATAMGNIGRTQAPVIGANGEIEIDPATGRPKMSAPGTTQLKDQARTFNATTGITDYKNTAEPGRGGTAASSVNATGYGDFSCTASPGSRRSITGRVIQFNGCSYASDGKIAGVTLSMCSATLQGGSCGETDFTQKLVYPVDQYSTIDGVSVGVGCNAATKVCRVTLNGNYSLAVNGSTMAKQGADQTQQAGTNTAQSTIADRYTSDAYTQKMAGTATQIDACAGGAMGTAAQNGTASTCDNKQTSSFSGTGVSGTKTCSDTPICIRKATTSASYTTSCSRNFPLTGYSCSFTVPKQECTVTKDVATGKKTSTCDSVDMTDSVKIETTEASPTCTVKDPVTSACKTQTWAEYYTFPKKATIAGECSASPLPLAGSPATSCINKGAGQTTSCETGGWWRRTLSDQECTVAKLSKDSSGNMLEDITQLTFAEKEGCGVCVSPKTSDTCYAKTTEVSNSCSAIDTSICTLQSSAVESSYNGLTLSQQETYSCTKSEETCVEYDRSNMCTNTNLAQGMDKPTGTQQTSQGLSQAMASAAVIDAISQSAQENDDPMVPKIFGGKDSRCKRPTGFFSGLLADDCCRTDLARPSGNSDDKCSMDEFKLSAARKANLTVYIGDYCSKTRGFGPFKTCVQKTQTYCAYPGILARVIQTQGRDQLTNMVNSSAGATLQKASTTFNFYSGNGGWNAPTVVNGISVAAWSYPAYCADASKATAAQMADPNALECPASLTQWFAVCDNPAGCGDLPTAPEIGSAKWILANVDPLKNVTTAISQYTMAAGACDPASTACKYDLAAWPAGVGGKAVVSRELDFPLYSAQTQDTKSLAVPEDLTNAGDLLFRPNSVAGTASPTAALPATILLDYSLDGGTTFLHANIPTRIEGTDLVLPNTDDVRITGGCDVAANTCRYRVTGTATVTAKPWGTAKSPDCSGFTLGQLSVLDFSKMDLSEWLASVTGSLSAPDAANLGAVAATRSQQLLDARNNNGVITATNPVRATAATLTPTQEFGPFVATLKVAGNWPEFYADTSKNVDPVTGVDIDWGDCGLGDIAAPVTEYINGVAASGFFAQHQYLAPDKVPLACGGGPKQITHVVKVKVHAKSGTHELSLQVVNLWDRYTNTGNGLNTSAGGNVSSTATAPANLQAQ